MYLEKQFSNNRRAVVKFFYYLRTVRMEDDGKKYQSKQYHEYCKTLLEEAN